MSGTEGKVAGTILISLREYSRKKWGVAGYEDMKNVLDYEIDKIAPERIYPISHAGQILEHVQRKKGNDELVRMGVFTVQNIGAKRYFALLLPVKSLVEKIKDTIDKISSSIEMDIRDGHNSVTVTMQSPHYNDVQAHFWKGMYQGVLQMAHKKGKVDMDTSGLKDDHRVIYMISWD